MDQQFLVRSFKKSLFWLVSVLVIILFLILSSSVLARETSGGGRTDYSDTPFPSYGTAWPPTYINETIDVPSDATDGSTWVRARLFWVDDGGAGAEGDLDPTGAADYGEVEDYEIIVAGDTTPPSVSVTNPSVKDTVSGTIDVQANASDGETGIDRVEFYVDNQLLGADYSEPYSYSWDTTANPEGDHDVKVIAYDGAGNSAEGKIWPVYVDNMLPSVIGTTAVGTYPYAVDTDPDTEQTYVGNYDSNNVSVIDGTTDLVTTTVPVGSNPWGVSVVSGAPSFAYVFCDTSPTTSVYVIDCSTNTVVDNFSVTLPVSAHEVVYSQTNDSFYVSNRNTDNVSVIDRLAKTVTTTISVGDRPRGIGICGGHVYVANSYGDTLSIIDTSTNTEVSTTPLYYPWGVAGNSSTDRVYVTYNYFVVAVIDGDPASPTFGEEIDAIPTNFITEGIGVNPTNNRVYVVNAHYVDTITVINGWNNEVIDTVPTGNDPHAVAANPSTNKAYVTNPTDNTVTIIQDIGVDTTPPDAFDLSAPSNGSLTNESLPTFSWNASSDAESGLAKYQLYIDGSLAKDDIDPAATSAQPDNPLSDGVHAWYVRAYDNAGNSTDSTSTWTLETDYDDLVIIRENLVNGNQRMLIYDAPTIIGGDLGAEMASDTWIGNANQNTDVTQVATGDFDGDGIKETCLIRENKATGNQRLMIYETPTTVGGDLGAPIATDEAAGNVTDNSNIILMTAQDFDSDNIDEIVLVRERVDNGIQGLYIYDPPVTLGGGLGPMIASDNWIGNSTQNTDVVLMSAGDLDNDGHPELALVRQSPANGNQRLTIHEAPVAVGGDTGPQIADDGWIGNDTGNMRVTAIAVGDFDGDLAHDEIALVRHNLVNNHQRLTTYNTPTTVGGDLGVPIATDWWIGNALQDTNVALMCVRGI